MSQTNPTHYHGKNLETIDVIEAFDLDFSLGNAVKYILRAGKKDGRTTDLRKARWYITNALKEDPQKACKAWIEEMKNDLPNLPESRISLFESLMEQAYERAYYDLGLRFKSTK